MSIFRFCFAVILWGFVCNKSMANVIPEKALITFRCIDSANQNAGEFTSVNGQDRKNCDSILPKCPGDRCPEHDSEVAWESGLRYDGYYRFTHHYKLVNSGFESNVFRGVVSAVKHQCLGANNIMTPNDLAGTYDAEYEKLCWPCNPADLVERPPQVIEKEVDGIKHKVTRRFSKNACPVDLEDIESCKVSLFNPIACRTGEKLQTETDYRAGDLQFSRKFRSQPEGSIRQSPQWFNTDEVTLNWLHQTTYDQIAEVQTGDGGRVIFSGNNSATVLVPTSPLRGNFEKVDGSWVWTEQKGTKHTFGAFGKVSIKTTPDGQSTRYKWEEIAADKVRLTEIVAPSGRSLRFQYNNEGLMTAMFDPSNGVTEYVHDDLGRLTHVTYADRSTREYRYEDSRFPLLLTGIIDENGQRFATYAYDDKARGILSEHAGHAQKGTFEYLENGNTIVQTHLNENSYRETLYVIDRVNGRERVLREEDFPCPGCTTGVVVNEYNSANWLTKSTDRNGNITTYVRDSEGRETSRTEAHGTAHARTTTTAYDSNGRAYDITTSLNRKYYSFNSFGLPSYLWEYDKVSGTSRTTYYNYTATGQLQSVDGPRTDVSDITTYTYDAQGNVSTITNAKGHVTQITAYDANGKPLTIIDPNGLQTTLTYTPRGWLETRTVGTLKTTFTYDKVGQLTKVTLPDASFISYEYDAAHRLTTIKNKAGEKIVYTLDYAGNRIKEVVFNASGVKTYSHGRTFNALSQLIEDINAQNDVVARYGYDANGNVTAQQRELDGFAQSNNVQAYDALNRLNQITDGLNGITDLVYDGNDNLTGVTDPKRLNTSYDVDGLGQLNQTTSPDTGATSQTFDSAGNLKTSTNANGKTTTYTYDELNRVSKIIYHDAKTVVFTYDTFTTSNFGKGRLSKITDASGSTTFVYNQRGQLTTKTQTISGRNRVHRYGYDSKGRVYTNTLPSGAVVKYVYNSNGQISSLQINNVTQLSAIAYQPFGGVKSFAYANGKTFNRTFDLDGRLGSFALASGTVNIGYDRAGRITTLGNQTFGYDALDRLISANGQSYGYDANGNRLSLNSTTYTVSNTSNRVTDVNAVNYQYDAAGNVTNDGSNTFTFNAANRLSKAVNANATADYVYNGLGQRVKKTVVQNGVTTTMLFAYDEAGRVVGTYNADGSLIQEIVYLNDIPVIVITQNANFYIHSDQLNTPREITNQSGTIVWKWENTDPFGANLANDDPDGDGTKFVFNHRLAGQYFDQETGKHYNYFRDYDPQTGRYIESDPVGLIGGINTYSYAKGNPVNFADPLGLWCLTANGYVTCQPPGGPLVRFPQPPGWPGSIRKGQFNYHEYNKWRKYQNVDLECLRNFIKNNPTPGNNNPATPEGTANDATPLDWRRAGGPSPVASYYMTYNGVPVVVNVTLPGHPLFPGYVARNAIGEGNEVTINNYGEGSGFLQNDLVPFNDWLINDEFYTQSDKAAEACSCGK